MSGQLSRILIIKHSEIAYDRVEQSLRQSDAVYQITWTRQVNEGLIALEQDFFPLVLLDISTLSQEDLKILHQIRERAAESKLLVVADAGQEPLVGQAMRVGASDFLIRYDLDGYLTLLPYFLEKNHVAQQASAESEQDSTVSLCPTSEPRSECEQVLLAETLAEVTLALTAQTRPAAVLQEILRQVKRIVPYDTANIMLLEGDTLRAAAWQGYNNFGGDELLTDLILPLSEFPIDAEAVESQDILIISDTYCDSRWVRLETTGWIRSFASVPICIGDALLGLLRLDADKPDFFKLDQIKQLQPLANAAAVALQNARLLEFARYEVAERRRVEAALFYQLELERLITKLFVHFINIFPDELDDSINQALQSIGEFIEAERSYIFLLSTGRLQIEKAYEWHSTDVTPAVDQLQSWILDCSPWFSERFARFEPIHIPNITKLPKAAKSDQALFERNSIRSMIMIPMEYGGTLVGFLGFDVTSQEKSWTHDTINLLKVVGEILVNAFQHKQAQQALRESEERYKTLFNNAPIAIFTKDCEGRYTSANADVSSYWAINPIGRTDFDLLPTDIAETRQSRDRSVLDRGREIAFEEQIQTRHGLRTLFSRIVPVLDGTSQIVGTLGISIDITERKRRERELETILSFTTALRRVSSPEQVVPVLLDQVLSLLDVDGVALIMRDFSTGNLVVELGQGAWTDWTGMRLGSDENWSDQVVSAQQPYLGDVSMSSGDLIKTERLNGLQMLVGVPLVVEKETIGALWAGHKTYLAAEIVPLLTGIAELAANTIHRTLLYERTEHNLQQMAALREVDIAITASMDSDTIFKVLFDQLSQMLGIDAVDLLIWNTNTSQLEYVVGQGFHRTYDGRFAMSLSTVLLEQLRRQKQMLKLVDLAYMDESRPLQRLKDEGFVTYFGVPLVIKGRLRGLLEIFHRTPLSPRADWFDFVEAMAGEAAIAIDNLTLFQDLQHSNAELSRMAAELRQLIDTANTPIFGVDDKGLINEWNNTIQQLTGYHRNEMVGRHLVEEVVIRHERSAMKSILGKALAGHETINDELTLDTKDGRQVLILLATTIRRNSSHEIIGVLLMGQDITERNQVRAALEAERAQLARRVEERTADLSSANAELARAARLKDEFLASMSHELRTPLNAILGMSEALQDQIYGEFNERQIKALQSIEESGRHLLALISDILDVAKIEAGKLELTVTSLAVEGVCQASLRLIKQAAKKKNLIVSSIFDSKVISIQTDARRLKQILVNLLSNAVKFTPEGGQIGLEVVGDPLKEVVHLTVWDTGIGISAEGMDRLFQPFVQLDSSLARRYGGTGLGLSLVYRMAELMGGSISVESEVETGSRFTVSLPWSPTETSVYPIDATDQSTYAKLPMPGLKHVLIIDSSLPTINQLTRYLSNLGVTTTVFTEQVVALEQITALQPDLIILDIALSAPPTRMILSQLKASGETKSIPVLIYSEIDERAQGAVLGAAAYLLKPATRAQLYGVLTEIFDSPTRIIPTLTKAPEIDGNQPLILLAEDNEANIATLIDYLMLRGYRVIVARNGLEAIERAREMVPDLILMDIQMPKIDGLETMRRLRSIPELSMIPIVALTALVMPGDREHCLAAGADEYLSKPISLKTLANRIEDHLREKVELAQSTNACDGDLLPSKNSA